MRRYMRESPQGVTPEGGVGEAEEKELDVGVLGMEFQPPGSDGRAPPFEEPPIGGPPIGSG